MKTRWSCLKSLTLLFLICQLAGSGWAQSYPAKPVRLILPSTPGSGYDIIGRIVAAGLAEVFGQQVIVDNRAGGAGETGAILAVRAPADGYTLFEAGSSQAARVILYRKPPYDLVRDFAPVTQLAIAPAVVVVHPSLPVKSIGDLVKLAKTRPGTIYYAGTTVGGASHVAAELFIEIAGVNMVHVPFRGGGDALTSILSGETSLFFSPFSAALPQIRQGRLRLLAVTSTQRLPLLPEYPTVAESGYPGFEFGNWYGILVPAKTPKATIAIIHGAAVSVLKNPAVGQRLSDIGFIIVGNQPEQFAAYIKSEIERHGRILWKWRGTLP